MVTTDKVYKRKEDNLPFKENDPLGGDDPYSASKASCEIAIQSWCKSFCSPNLSHNSSLKVVSVRAGNVIGGGDWSDNRIVPDMAACPRSIVWLY